MRLTNPRAVTEPSREKGGNCVWTACPACDTAFPVSLEMIGQRAVPMHCPGCHHNFVDDHGHANT